MQSDEIRRRFLDFFGDREHTVVPSASLISPDPALLLTVAGMVPFMPYFLGQQQPPYPRATSVQKCVRTLDIDEVGKTTRHGSFFQMAGNFSFGDYFKERAIPLAWELLTGSLDAGGYGLDPDRLWVTVFETDDEAADIWTRDVGFPVERLQRLDMSTNYWSTGAPGPSGPCSEIFYDLGPDAGRDGGPAVDDERFREVWNLVFMQEERGAGAGKDFPILGELPAKSIDTGLGLERLAAILQGARSIYDIDTSKAILDRAAEIAGVTYGKDQDADVRLRIVADHVRTAVMLVGDGIRPGNEGREYVLRRIVRRAVRAMRLLGAPDGSAAPLIEATIGAMGPQYPELVTDTERINAVLVGEEGSFLETLKTGAAVFDQAVPAAKASGVLGGDRAFALHDTYGFPIDLTLEMAAEQGLSVDTEGFQRLMGEQRDRAKSDARTKRGGGADTSAYRDLLEVAGATAFTGYTEVVTEATVRGLLAGGARVQSASEGDTVELVLDRTPFYAESGGQLADHGRLVLGDAELEIVDVQKGLPDLVVHRALVRRGSVEVGAQAQAQVDVERRKAISRAHTATHLVHTALRKALGQEATQAGSENRPGSFRFDFSSPGQVPASVLRDVEQEINEITLADLEVRAFVTSQDEAKKLGAIALFGEKYGDEVRVVEVGDYARELCGGTHAARSSQLGTITLLSEGSIGSGTRRVEGLVGLDAHAHLAREHVLLAGVAAAMKVRPEELPERIAATLARLKDAEREVAQLRAGKVLQQAAELATGAIDVSGVAFVAVQAPDATPGDLVRSLALDIRGRLAGDRPGVVLVAAGGDRVSLVAAVNEAGQARGLSAHDILREAAQAVGGKGGGKADVAQGGGSDAAGIGVALNRAEQLVGRVAAS